MRRRGRRPPAQLAIPLAGGDAERLDQVEDRDAAGDADQAEDLAAGAGENPITALAIAGGAQLAQLADLALDLAASRQTPAAAHLSQLGAGSQKSVRLAL